MNLMMGIYGFGVIMLALLILLYYGRLFACVGAVVWRRIMSAMSRDLRGVAGV